jgi:hypothetical protein
MIRKIVTRILPTATNAFKVSVGRLTLSNGYKFSTEN